MALAVVVGADRDGHGAGRIEPDLGMLDQPGIGGLDGARHAEPAQLAAPARLGAAGGKAGIVRLDQAVLQVLAEVAAVIGVDQRRLVGHRSGRDHVAPAQLRAIDAELARGEIDHGLDHVGGLGPAGAAIGTGQHGVGEDRGDFGMDRGDHIGAREHADIVGGRAGIAVGIVVGADVGVVAHRKSEEASLVVEGELGIGDVVAAVLVGLASPSLRSEIHFTGRPTSRAASAVRTYSG